MGYVFKGPSEGWLPFMPALPCSELGAGEAVVEASSTLTDYDSLTRLLQRDSLALRPQILRALRGKRPREAADFDTPVIQCSLAQDSWHRSSAHSLSVFCPPFKRFCPSKPSDLSASSVPNRVSSTSAQPKPPRVSVPQNALITAVQLCDIPTIAHLLRPALDPTFQARADQPTPSSLLEARSARGRSALHAACARADSGVLVRALVAAGADILAVDDEGCTPLGSLRALGPAASANAVALKQGLADRVALDRVRNLPAGVKTDALPGAWEALDALVD